MCTCAAVVSVLPVCLSECRPHLLSVRALAQRRHELERAGGVARLAPRQARLTRRAQRAGQRQSRATDLPLLPVQLQRGDGDGDGDGDGNGDGNGDGDGDDGDDDLDDHDDDEGQDLTVFLE